MPETFYPAGIVIALAGGILGAFIARELNVPYYVIIGIGVLLTALGIPLIQLAGGVAVAIAVAKLISGYVQEVS